MKIEIVKEKDNNGLHVPLHLGGIVDVFTARTRFSNRHLHMIGDRADSMAIDELKQFIMESFIDNLIVKKSTETFLGEVIGMMYTASFVLMKGEDS